MERLLPSPAFRIPANGPGLIPRNVYAQRQMVEDADAIYNKCWVARGVPSASNATPVCAGKRGKMTNKNVVGVSQGSRLAEDVASNADVRVTLQAR